MKTFIGSIGGITSRMTGGDTYEVLTETDRHVQKKDSPIDSRLSLSSEEDSHLHGEEDSFDFEAPKKSGTVNKWTNYLHGWQERFFVVGDGILSYYKSEFDTQYGCRGSISLHKVKILVSPSGRRGVCICPLHSRLAAKVITWGRLNLQLPPHGLMRCFFNWEGLCFIQKKFEPTTAWMSTVGGRSGYR